MSTSFRKVTAVQWVKDSTATTFRGSRAVAFASDNSLVLRNIQGFAFESPLPQLVLRNLQGYAFQRAKLALPLSVTGDQALYQLINNNSKYNSWSASNSTLGTPAASSAQPNANTVVNLAALSASGYGGNINLYYNRRSLSDAFPNQFALNPPASDSTIYNQLSMINSVYSLNLTQQDVNDGPVPAGSTKITLTAASGSWLFLPGTSVVAGMNATMLLTHFDGTNGATSTTDASGLNTISLLNGGQLATAQSKFGGSSYLSGSTSTAVAQMPDQTWLRGTANITYEAWVYSTSFPAVATLFRKDPNTTPYACLRYNGSQWQLWLDSTGASPDLAATAAMSANTWYHIALVRYNGTWTLYQNGVSIGSIAGNRTFGNSTSPFGIGNLPNVGGGPWLGYIDEVRVSNIARYTANFTPPSAAFTVD